MTKFTYIILYMLSDVLSMLKRLKSAIAVFVFEQLGLIFLCVSAIHAHFSPRYFNGLKIGTAFKCIFQFEETVPILSVNFGNRSSQDSHKSHTNLVYSHSFLFIVLIDYMLQKATEDSDSGVVTHPRQSRRHPAKVLNDLDFADDIALLESSIPRAQAQLTRTAAAAEDLGLIISVPKTEYMTVNCSSHPTLQVYGKCINHVSDFKYLGCRMASSYKDLTLVDGRH